MKRSLETWSVGASIVLCLGWVTFHFSGHALARSISTIFQGPLVRAADGKFSDPIAFVYGRASECLWLATLMILFGFALAYLWKYLGKRPTAQPARGLITGVCGFILLNVLAFFAGSTVAFWIPFYNKVQVDNFAQYQIKKTLFDEVVGQRRAVLLGSSQTNRSIDEVLLNQQIGKKLWTTELTQPGARGFDMLTLSRDIPFSKGDVMICYLSEIMFYGKGSGIVAAEFINFPEVRDAVELNGWKLLSTDSVQSGLLGRILPLYRFRNSFSHRVLGWTIANTEQMRFDHSLIQNLDQQANSRAPGLRIGETSDFEQAAFSRMVGELSAKGCKLIIIEGHTHPALRKYLDPAVITHLHGFLSNLKKQHPLSVTLMDGSSIFTPSEADFADLVHFTESAQTRFTHGLATYLDFHISDEDWNR